ncbi:MAG: four helix bundle protein [Planctomycetota bacterium]
MSEPNANLPAEIGQRAFDFAVRIVAFCRTLDQKPGVNWTLSRQLLRSGTSVGANIEEGKGSQSRADFCSKYSIAVKEARETLYWLRLIEQTGVASSKELAELLREADEIVRVLTAIVKKVKANP